MPADLRSRRKGGEHADDFLACRTYSHAWDRFSPIGMDAPHYGWRLSLRCLRCTSERHDVISYRTGVVETRRYIYAEGYEMQGVGEDKPTKEQFREELFVMLRGELKRTHALASDEPEPRAKKAAAAKKTAAKKSNVTHISKARKTTKKSA